MNFKPIIKEIIATYKVHGDPVRVEKANTYISTSMKVLGLTNPEVKETIRELKRRYTNWEAQDWISLCKALVEEGIFECQVLAFEIIGRDKKLLSKLRYEDLKDLGQNLDNWASVDHYTVGIFGVLWGKGVVKDHHIERLLESDNFWDRRRAVVSSVALNLKSRGGSGDTPRTIRVCERVVDERHDMIQKALSWALRELSKRDRNSVINFMGKHKSRLANRVIREVTHKLDFGTKN